MDEFVPRPEFELLCKSMNGSLVRIESTLTLVNHKLDGLAEADNLRVTWDAYDRRQDAIDRELKEVKGRPSWFVTSIIGFFATGFFTTLTLVLTGVIK